MQTFLSMLFLFIACNGTLNPPKVVVAVALEIILQPTIVFPSVRNKNSKNSENPEITPNPKIHCTRDLSNIFWTWMYYINFINLLERYEIWTNKLYHLLRILVTKIRVNFKFCHPPYFAAKTNQETHKKLLNVLRRLELKM